MHGAGSVRELVVVRHGESEGNARGLAQGRRPYPLTERGRRQAGLVGDLLARMDWVPDLVVSSPVLRCVETARLIAARLEAPAPVTDEAFTEIDCGRATGRAFVDLEREHPDFFARPASEWLGFHEMGGESDEQVVGRVGRGLDALPAGAGVLLVTHGAVFKGVLAHVLGLTTHFFLDLRHTTCLRLEARRVGTSSLHALTHLLHADEIV